MLDAKAAPSSKGSIIASGADAPGPEVQNLIAIYSALVRGLKSDTVIAWPEPTSATHFWSQKLAWIYTSAHDEWQRGLMASLVAAFINKRRAEVDTLWLTQEVANIWRDEVQGNKHGQRAAAILSYFTVCHTGSPSPNHRLSKRSRFFVMSWPTQPWRAHSRRSHTPTIQRWSPSSLPHSASSPRARRAAGHT